MADQYRDKFLYKPLLKEERHYRSEGDFPDNDLVIPTGPVEDPMEDLIEQYDEILPLVHKLPEGLSSPIEDLIQKLKLRMQIIRYENPPPGVTVYPPGPTNPGVPINGGEPHWIPHIKEWTVVIPGSEVVPGHKPVKEKEHPLPTFQGGTIYPPRTPGTIEGTPHEHSTHTPKGSKTGTSTHEPIIDIYQPKGGGTLPPVIGEKEEPPKWIDPTVDIPKKYTVGTDVITELPTIPGLPSLFPDPTNKPIKVKVPRSLVQIAQDSYKKDQIDLQSYYLQQLQYALRQYFQSMMMVMTEVGIGDINALTREYHGDVVDINDKNLQHLGDAIERSQVQRGQRTRYFRKMCSTSQTLQHMRMWHASEKERERYYGEAYGDSRNYLDSESNAILRKSRAQYDQSYKSSLYNMYRYLDSSVEVTKDILNMTLQEAQAKGKLLKEGVDVFAQPEVVTEMHNESESQATDSTAIIQNNKGQGSGNGNVFDSNESGNDAANTSGSAATSASGGYDASGTTQGQNDAATARESAKNRNSWDATSDYNGSSNESNDRWSWENWNKKGSGTGSDDSGIKAPNGYNYSKNDIEYLTAQGMSQDDAIKTLSKDPKYKGAGSSFNPYDKGTGEDDSGIKAPNGKNYSKNDIEYLKSKGYTSEQAVDILSKDENYVVHDAKYQEKVREQVAIKMGLQEDPEKLSKYTAPNGKKIEKNDIKYLKSKGYSESNAVAELRKANKYKSKDSGVAGLFTVGGGIFGGTNVDATAKKEKDDTSAYVQSIIAADNARQERRRAESDARIEKEVAGHDAETKRQQQEAKQTAEVKEQRKARQQQQEAEQERKAVEYQKTNEDEQQAAEEKARKQKFEETASLLEQINTIEVQYRKEEKDRYNAAWDAAHPECPRSKMTRQTPLYREWLRGYREAEHRGTEKSKRATQGLKARWSQVAGRDYSSVYGS